MTSTPFWGPDFDALQAEDPEIADVVLDELTRLRSGLQLIARGRRNPDLVTLDGRLNFLEPAILDRLRDLLGDLHARFLVDRDPVRHAGDRLFRVELLDDGGS